MIQRTKILNKQMQKLKGEMVEKRKARKKKMQRKRKI